MLVLKVMEDGRCEGMKMCRMLEILRLVQDIFLGP